MPAGCLERGTKQRRFAEFIWTDRCHDPFVAISAKPIIDSAANSSFGGCSTLPRLSVWLIAKAFITYQTNGGLTVFCKIGTGIKRYAGTHLKRCIFRLDNVHPQDPEKTVEIFHLFVDLSY